MLSIGQVLQDRYRIDALLGKGGMGAVYQAFDLSLHRTIAVKLLAPHLVWESEFVARFMREARSAANLRHPNIIDVHDVGQDGDNYYFVMAYLPGGTLKHRLLNKKYLAPEEVVDILRPLASALDYAHRKGLVHRDVKTVNVLFDELDTPVLTDFGIVKAAQETKLTVTGASIGTPQYMAPEQVLGKAVDGRVDQYALGIVAFELLSGQVPFDGDTTATILHKQAYEAPPPIRSIVADLPTQVEGVISRVLAKSADDRYRTCEEFVSDLEKALQPPVVQATPAPAPGSAPTVVLSTTPPAQAAAQPEPERIHAPSASKDEGKVHTTDRGDARRASRRAFLIGAAGVAAGGGLVLLLSNRSPGSVPAPTETSPPTDTPATPVTFTPQAAAISTNRAVLSLAQGVTLELVRVPAGEFLMGSADSDTQASSDEKPQSKLALDEYWIGKYDVTNYQYAAFAQASGHNFTMPSDKADHPVVDVSWDDAVAFCAWANQVVGRKVRLPSEAQWEKAARGTDGRLYPWGNDSPDSTHANFNSSVGDTTPVGKYSPQGDSPYGAADMAGNAWQWTSSLYKPYPYKAADGREDQQSRGGRVFRGGSFLNAARLIRCADRFRSLPVLRNVNLGFRVVASPI